MSAAAPSLSSTLAYCRDARRVRDRLAASPERMHRSLRRLPTPAEREASFSPAATRVSRSTVRPVAASRSATTEPWPSDAHTAASNRNPVLPPHPAANPFAARVVAALRDGPIRYDVRRRLLAAAVRYGIDRFEANLIVAQVEHRFQARATLPLPQRSIFAVILLAISLLALCAFTWLQLAR